MIAERKTTRVKFVNVREFKLKATQFLKSSEEVVITRYGKPVARLVPETEETIVDAVQAMGRLFREANVTQEDALAALERARRKVYGPRRQTARRAPRHKVAA
jgi:antitoxin (DNA-binding transcriptional repressor) of toxin-antitoxin stability system